MFFLFFLAELREIDQNLRSIALVYPFMVLLYIYVQRTRKMEKEKLQLYTAMWLTDSRGGTKLPGSKFCI